MVFAAGAWEVLAGKVDPRRRRINGRPRGHGLRTGRPPCRSGLRVFEQTAASVDRLGEILDLEADVVEPESVDRLVNSARSRRTGPGQAVEFDRVGFGYRTVNEPVVWDIRLKVEPGTKIALVGPTGCGKSTLVNLLDEVLRPDLGRDPPRRRANSAHSRPANSAARSAW